MSNILLGGEKKKTLYKVIKTDIKRIFPLFLGFLGEMQFSKPTMDIFKKICDT